MVSNARLAARIRARVPAESVHRPSASSSGRSAVLQQACRGYCRHPLPLWFLHRRSGDPSIVMMETVQHSGGDDLASVATRSIYPLLRFWNPVLTNYFIRSFNYGENLAKPVENLHNGREPFRTIMVGKSKWMSRNSVLSRVLYAAYLALLASLARE